MTKPHAAQMNLQTPLKKGRGIKMGRNHSFGFLEDMVRVGKYLNRKQRKALDKLTRPHK